MRELLGAVALLLLLGGPAAAGEPRFGDVFERHAAVMLLIEPESGRIVDANPAAAQFYGLGRPDLRKMTIQDINILTPEQVSQERRLAQNEGRNFFIFRHRLGSGEVRTVEVRSSPVEVDRQRLLLSIVNDVTPNRRDEETLWHYQTRLEQMVDEQVRTIVAGERRLNQALVIGGALQSALIVGLVVSMLLRRRSEQRFRDVSEAAGEYIWETDVAGRYTFVSERAKEVLGYRPQDILGRTPFDLMPPDEAERVRAWYAATVAGGRPFHGLVHRNLHLDGRETWLEVNGIPRRGLGGRVLGYRGAALDITKRMVLEQERERTLAVLSRTNEEMARLAEVMAHHFQEPARRMVTYAQRLRRDAAAAEADARTSLDFIETEAMRLRNLVQDVQVYLAAGRAEPTAAAVDAAAVLQAELDRRAAAMKDAQVTVAPLPRLKMDRRRLRDLFAALLDNAIHHRAPGRPLALRVHAEPAGSRAVIRFADNGPGIPEGYRERVFRLFERLGPDGGSPGTGIGLSVVRKIVETAGGRVRIEDSPGGGACIVFDLPAEA